MTYKELPESTLNSGVFLYCDHCEGQYSATRGDYFLMADEEEIVCECSEPAVPMFLAYERHIIEAVRTEIARA